jgi:hypothetical protein
MLEIDRRCCYTYWCAPEFAFIYLLYVFKVKHSVTTTIEKGIVWMMSAWLFMSFQYTLFDSTLMVENCPVCIMSQESNTCVETVEKVFAHSNTCSVSLLQWPSSTWETEQVLLCANTFSTVSTQVFDSCDMMQTGQFSTIRVLSNNVYWKDIKSHADIIHTIPFSIVVVTLCFTLNTYSRYMKANSGAHQ